MYAFCTGTLLLKPCSPDRAAAAVPGATARTGSAASPTRYRRCSPASSPGALVLPLESLLAFLADPVTGAPGLFRRSERNHLFISIACNIKIAAQIGPVELNVTDMDV